MPLKTSKKIAATSLEGINESSARVFFVGLRWPQHASVSGYDAIIKYLGERVSIPIQSRWPWYESSNDRLYFRVKNWLSKRVSTILEWALKPTYSFALLRMELSVAKHMLFHRRAIYHVLYGETDVCILGFVGKLTRNYVVASFHDSPQVLRDCGISKVISQSLSGVILLGSCQKSYFREYLPEDRIHLVPHGVNSAFFTPSETLRNRKLSADDEVLIITVGGHTRDFRTLSLVFRSLRQKLPRVRFVAVSANVGNKGEKLSGEDIEHVSGLTDAELRSLYRTASVAVFAFKYAVANNSILEAMSCGTPIVATNIGSVREYVTKEAGILTPISDVEAMVAGVMTILSSQRLQEQMSIAARRNAEEFDIETICLNMKKSYRKIEGVW